MCSKHAFHIQDEDRMLYWNVGKNIQKGLCLTKHHLSFTINNFELNGLRSKLLSQKMVQKLFCFLSTQIKITVCNRFTKTDEEWGSITLVQILTNFHDFIAWIICTILYPKYRSLSPRSKLTIPKFCTQQKCRQHSIFFF